MTPMVRARIGVPSLLAGPLVVLFTLAQWWAGSIPQVIEPHVALLTAVPVVMFLATLIGFPVAALSNWVGSNLLIALGDVFPLVRFPLVWPLVGGALSWVVTTQIVGSSKFAFPFVAAGACCALLCRIRLEDLKHVVPGEAAPG